MLGLRNKTDEKDNNESSERKATKAPNNYPLFFSDPRVISLDRHAQAGLRPETTMKFAGATNSIPLTVMEITEAAKYYPVAFTMQDPIIPVVIVWLESENYFIDQKGNWLENYYVPAYVRKYPFLFMEMPGSDQLTLCVDEAAIDLKAQAQGTKLYEEGKPSTFTNNALEFCAAYQEQSQITRRCCDMLKRLELLAPQRSDIELANKRKIQLGGFQLIDTRKLKALSDQDVLAMHKDSSLPLLYYCLQSQSNWQLLLDLANKKESGNKAETF
jgi:hypothetical protein